jgi:arylsulfatase A-like enzyme
MVDQTLDFIHKNPDRPCFVNLWLDDTHTPFVPSAEQINVVRQKGEGELRTKYKAVLTDLDQQIGRLLDGLRETSTLVLFLGDNGASPPFERERSGGLRGQKLSLYEGGIRVPSMVWWPGHAKPGIVNDQTVIASIDLLPTLAAVAGAKLPEDCRPDGEDMSAALRGEVPQRTRPLFWEYGRNATSFAYPKDAHHRSPNVAVRDGRWKLLINADGSRAELYDLAADPQETKNLASDQSAVTRQLSTAALQWRRSLP